MQLDDTPVAVAVAVAASGADTRLAPPSSLHRLIATVLKASKASAERAKRAPSEQRTAGVPVLLCDDDRALIKRPIITYCKSPTTLPPVSHLAATDGDVDRRKCG